MTDLAPLFDHKGNFTPYPQDVLDSLPPERVALYQNVREKAEKTAAIEAELQHEMKVTCPERAAAVAELENVLKRNRPDFMALWREMKGSSHGAR